MRHRIDVIHVQCVSTNGFYALRAARHLGLPLVVTAQGELTMDADRAYERPGGLNDVLAELLEHADHVTGCSQYVLECLLAHRGRPFVQPTSVIFNGVTLTDFDGPSVVPHKHKAPYILGIGRWVPQKGFDVLIRAFARAARRPEFKHDLLLAGTGPEESHLGRIIAEEGLTDRAVLLGRADRRLATSLFAGCSFFVLPSRIEPFGIVNLEAMAARKPVIATSVGGVSEIVDHAGTGILVPPEDVESLASAMGHLSEDAAARERLAAAGRQFASAFDWHLIADRYIQLYRDVSGGVNYQ